MNKIALGIDIASQSSRVSEQTKLVSAITSLNTGSDKFSDILSAQQNKVEPPKKDEIKARESKAADNEKSSSRAAEANSDRSRATEKVDRSDSKRDMSNSTDNEVKKVASEETGKSSEEISGKSESADDASDVKPDEVSAKTSGDESEANTGESAGEEVAQVTNSEETAKDSVTLNNLDVEGELLIEEGAASLTVTDEISETVNTTLIEGEGSQESPLPEGIVGDEVASVLMDESVASEAAISAASSETEGVVVLGENADLETDQKDVDTPESILGSFQGSTGSQSQMSEDSVIQNTEGVVSADLPEKVTGEESVVQSAPLNVNPAMATAGGIEEGEPELVNARLNSGESRNAASQLTSALSAGSSSGSSGEQSAGGQSGGQAGNNGQGNALFLKGLENAAMKSAVMGDKVVSSDKFAGLLSQQLEGLDTRMTQSPMDSRLNLNQLREIPGLRTYTTSLPVPMNQADWGEEFSSKVTWLVNQKIQSAEIHVNPQELGPIKIEINMQNDQANVVINSQHASVRDLLELNVQRLRDMMDGSGVDLGDVDVSDQSAEQQASSSDGQSASGQGHASSGGETMSDESTQPTSVVRMGPVSLVDYYA